MQLPEFLGFFSGKRFVAIATAFLSFILGLLLPYIWQHIRRESMRCRLSSMAITEAASTFIFGLVERALIPLGLHHIWYPSFWYSFGDYTHPGRASYPWRPDYLVQNAGRRHQNL